MTPELWQRAQALFFDALDQPQADREAWLLRACAEEQEVLTLVQSMLSKDAVAGEQSVVPVAQILAEAEQPDLKIGEELGPYRIVSFLGAGGMGQVFRAERVDGVVKQEVAIKLLRHHASAAELRRRFAIERRILARLSHPGIARFLDAGADIAGRPYVAMELIIGMPITAFARQNRLDLRARLQLFAQVLDAVSYAHAQLIVHRDIKPGNVLVDQSGNARLLDFGIAKPLSDIDEALRAEGATETTMRAYSLKYAAPEQLKGEAIGVGCDVYALGGLLYELLTDQSALDLQDLAVLKAQEKVCHHMPVAPSERALPSDSPYSNKQLKGDLDRMVLHALKKEAHERYLTVAAFAADVQSHLAQEPISLRSGVTGYRVAKFVQRHKAPVAIAALLLLSLVTLVATLLLSNISIRREKALAQTQQARAEKTTQFMLDIFRAANPELNGGQPPSAKDLARIASQNFRSESNTDAQLRNTLLPVLIDVQSGLGDFAGAVELSEELIKQLPNDDARRAEALAKRANAAWQGGDTEQAERDLVAFALIPQEKISATVKGYVEYVRGLIAFRNKQDKVLAIAHYQAAEKYLSGNNDLLNPLRFQAMVQQARMLAWIKKTTEAAIVIKRLNSELPNKPTFAALHLQALMATSQLEFRLGHLEKAKEISESATKLSISIFGREHINTALALQELAGNQIDLGQTAISIETYKEVLRIFRLVLPSNHPKIGGALLNLAVILRDEGKLPEATTLLEEGFNIISEKMTLTNSTTQFFGETLIDAYQRANRQSDVQRILHIFCGQGITINEQKCATGTGINR
jgi:eukaryotic-like serine/threonine-protein kinase